MPKRRRSIRFTTKRREDMPWCGSMPVVSEKLRDLIEDSFPDHAQFIPLSVSGGKRGENYFAANWLHVVDCIDLKKSEVLSRDKNERGEIEYDFDRIAINPKRVPKGVFIFRPRHWEVSVVCDSIVRDTFRKHKITGPQFYKSI